nr:MlaD family protein [Mycolicibacterium sp. lyk4-40-TYG-92]
MDVHDISGLVVGSSVQLRGVPVGQVTDIATTVEGAAVKFDIDSRYTIPIDSEIRLETLSALGEAYIEVAPRSDSGPALRDGQRLAADAITQPPTISDLATTVIRILNQFEPAALDRIIKEADVALPNPTTVLPNLTRTATLLRNTAAAMNGKGRDLLDNFQALLRNAHFVGPVLAFNAPWLTKMGHDMAAMNVASEDLHNRGAPQTLHNLSHLVGRLEHFLDHSGGDIKVLTQSMLPYLNDMSGALMNLDTGQVFNNMLAAVPEDGAVTVHLTIPDSPAPAAPADSH